MQSRARSGSLSSALSPPATDRMRISVVFLIFESGVPLVGLALGLWLLLISVAFGALTGVLSVIAGLGDHSLGVFGVGLGVLADVTGSAVLIWRFRAERSKGGPSGRREARAAVVVAAALAARSRPGTSALALAVAGVSLVVLTPLPLPSAVSAIEWLVLHSEAMAP